MGVNSLPKTASRLRFEPGPFCASVQHNNHSATEPPTCIDAYFIDAARGRVFVTVGCPSVSLYVPSIDSSSGGFAAERRRRQQILDTFMSTFAAF